MHGAANKRERLVLPWEESVDLAEVHLLNFSFQMSMDIQVLMRTWNNE